MRNFILPAILTSAFLMGCGSGGGGVKSSAGSWFGGSSFKVQDYRVKTLPNGLTVIYVADEALPRLSLAANIRAGSLTDPEAKQGLAYLVTSTISKGTTTRSATDLSEAFNRLGTEMAVSVNQSTFTGGADALSTDADKLLELVADVLMKPAFQEPEIRRAKQQIVASIRKRIDNPSSYSRFRFNDYVFEGSPFSRETTGTVESVQKLGRTDVIKQYFALFRPNNTIITVTGRFTPDFEKKVEETFGAWTQREVPALNPALPASPESLQVKLVTKRGLAQTQVLMGTPMIPRKHPDYIPMILAAEALGGGFGSRLMQKIRDDLGLTYSISAGYSGYRETGLFSISTFTKNPSVGQTLKEILAVYDQFVAQGITEKELASAKAQIVGQYPRSLETPEGVAGVLVGLLSFDLPLSEIHDFPGRVEKTSLNEVNEAIKKHLRPQALKVLVYGDRAVIGPQLKDFNPKIEIAK